MTIPDVKSESEVSTPSTPSVPTGYSPSPRPRYDGPSAIPYASVTRHVWGDAEAGEVFDWIYASTDHIHALVFGLAPGGAFRHSREFRTVFGADEVLSVLSGTMVLANPETGEVIRVPTGDSAFFGAGIWHHVYAHGSEPLRVLELLAPPPAKGTTGAYARSREYLEDSRYVDNSVFGHVPGDSRANPSFNWLRPNDVVYRLEGDGLVGILASTDQLTVATLTLPPGKAGNVHTHGGDEILYVRKGTLSVRAWTPEGTRVFELSPKDAAFIPAGVPHEYRNYEASEAEAVMGVAPSYLDVAGEPGR
jgi:quercetin dioxygenase-like cupin family protein